MTENYFPPLVVENPPGYLKANYQANIVDAETGEQIGELRRDEKIIAVKIDGLFLVIISYQSKHLMVF